MELGKTWNVKNVVGWVIQNKPKDDEMEKHCLKELSTMKASLWRELKRELNWLTNEPQAHE